MLTGRGLFWGLWPALQMPEWEGKQRQQSTDLYAKQAGCQDAILSNAQLDVVSLYKPTCQESLSLRKDPWLLRQHGPKR